jgi:Glycosyl transferase family 11
MSVKVNLLERFGNNLFQYALGRIIAERHGLEFECRRLNGLGAPTFMIRKQDTRSIATLDTLTKYFPGAPLRIPGRRVDTPVERFEMGPDSAWDGHMIDLQLILANRTLRQIRLSGYFHRYEYFAPYRDRIRQWFRCTPMKMPFEVASNDVLVNIRRGVDYGILNWTLSLSYYERALSSLRNVGRVFVCGTGVDDQVHHLLSKYKPVYYNGSPIQHFYFMTRFNRLVLSNSTFAWWAAFLSDAEEIYAPRAPHANAFGFTGFRDVDLHMRESRYHEVDNTSVAKFGFLIPKNDAVAEFDNADSQLLIKCSQGRQTTIDVDGTNRDLLVWLIQQKRPIEIDEARDRYMGNDLFSLIIQILESGLMHPDLRYADHDGN